MHNNVNQDQNNTNFQHTVLCILSTILCVKHKRYNIDIFLNGTILVFAIRSYQIGELANYVTDYI